MDFNSNPEINTDLVENFLESIIKPETLNLEEIKEIARHRDSDSETQKVKTSICEKLMEACVAFSSMVTNQSNEIKKKDNLFISLEIDLMEVYTQHITDIFIYFEGNMQQTIGYVMPGFNHLKEQMGDPNNKPLRYLEEALAYLLQEDPDFLGTFLRALELIDRDYFEKINTFAWIAGMMVDTDTVDTQLLYSDWVRTVYEPYMESLDKTVADALDKIVGDDTDEWTPGQQPERKH